MVDDEDEDVLRAAGLAFDKGFDFFYSGQSDKALAAFHEAYGIYQRAGVNEGQTDCLLYIAIVFSYEGRYEDVVVTYRKALRLAPQASRWRRRLTWLSNMGRALERLARYEEALDSYREALQVHREFGRNECLQITWLNDAGHVLQRFGRHDEALESYREALEICRRTDCAGRQKADCLESIGLSLT